MSDIDANAAFFTATMRQLRGAQTVAQLELAAKVLDSSAFEALPEAVREELAVFYGHRLLMITGAFS